MSRIVFDKDYKLATVNLIVEDKMDVKELFKFIELYDNSIRMYSALGYATHREFEEKHSQINLT